VNSPQVLENSQIANQGKVISGRSREILQNLLLERLERGMIQVPENLNYQSQG
jgi:hypothetical protein